MKLFKYYNLKTIIIFILCCGHYHTYAQKNNTYSNKKATILSIACPGLGQCYNKKYWKAPIIYAGLSGSMYFYLKNNNQYNSYKSSYIAETDDDPNTINSSNYTASNLVTLKNYYRNNRDIAGLLFLLCYLLNIMDAAVDSHLLDYNINDDLSLNLKTKDINNTDIMSICLKLSL